MIAFRFTILTLLILATSIGLIESLLWEWSAESASKLCKFEVSRLAKLEKKAELKRAAVEKSELGETEGKQSLDKTFNSSKACTKCCRSFAKAQDYDAPGPCGCRDVCTEAVFNAEECMECCEYEELAFDVWDGTRCRCDPPAKKEKRKQKKAEENDES